jgi:hypothetical protein
MLCKHGFEFARGGWVGGGMGGWPEGWVGKTKGFIKPLALGWIGGSREKVRGEYRV